MIDLYTAATRNGWKASVTLEELALPYSVKPIDLGAKQQKVPRLTISSPRRWTPASP